VLLYRVGKNGRTAFLHFTAYKTEAHIENSAQRAEPCTLSSGFSFPRPCGLILGLLSTGPRCPQQSKHSQNHKGGVEPLDVALPSAETSLDKTNKFLDLASCSGERRPRKIKDPVVTPFRAVQLGSAPRPQAGTHGPLDEDIRANG
jgi:hypothetical protein